MILPNTSFAHVPCPMSHVPYTYTRNFFNFQLMTSAPLIAFYHARRQAGILPNPLFKPNSIRTMRNYRYGNLQRTQHQQRSPYAILGVKTSATSEEIKESFRKVRINFQKLMNDYGLIVFHQLWTLKRAHFSMESFFLKPDGQTLSS